jgi:mannitol-1-/sugar-/sorbitol-6-phosphatase
MLFPSVSSPVELHCKGLLFDMDGILISSIASVERCWTKWTRLHGLDPESALKIVHGCRAIDTMRRLHPELDLEKEVKILEDFEVADQEGVHALPGVLELLAVLPVERWTVVTSATDRLARARLAAVGIVPPAKMVTGDDVAEGKPDPAPYLAGASKLGFSPEECVVFEDAPSGVASGRAAGCKVVATTFTHKVSDLTGADYLLEDLSGVRVEVGPQGIRLRL